MSVFQLPKTLCNDINCMMAKFWWGRKGNESNVAWMSWNKMGRANEIGGLGFPGFGAMLAKQGWRIVQNPDSMGNFLDTPMGKQPSYVWRSLWNARYLLKAGMRWRVGDGRHIKIWGDKWILVPTTYEIQSRIRVLDREAKVCDLIDNETQWWNIPSYKKSSIRKRWKQFAVWLLAK